MDLQTRKPTRLKDYNYSQNGAYFITVCTKNRKAILSNIDVGAGVLDGPKNRLSEYGKIAEKQIGVMNKFYDDISVDQYVIMPNHIHFIIQISAKENGSSGMPTPTNSIVSKFVGTFKRFCNREYGENIWQRSYHDHVIRGEKDYLEIWEYIENNPYKWEEDNLYIR